MESMRVLGGGSACLVWAFLLAGCASLPRPVDDAAERFEFAGGSVLPPQAGPWQVVREDEQMIMFVRGMATAGHEVFVQVAVQDRTFDSLAAYRDFLEQSTGGDPRFAPLHVSFEIEDDAGGPGSHVRPAHVRGALSLERDSGAGLQRLDNVSHNYLLADGRQVILSATQRYPADAEPIDLDPELAVMFQSFEPADLQR